MARDYYRVLDLPNGASLPEIKKAYRTKAKEYHPDRNDHPRAEEAFILVNEAYAYLSDPVRRASIDKQRYKKYSEERRRREYQAWVDREQSKVRSSAKRHAGGSFEKFARSPIYRAAMVLNEVYNYVFLGVGILMIVMPVLAVFISPEFYSPEFNYYSLIFPVIIGAAFVYGIWYFVLNAED